MTAPKVSCEDAEAFIRRLNKSMDPPASGEVALAYLRAVVSALDPEPSAVKCGVCGQETDNIVTHCELKASAVEELLRAAEQAERLLMGHTEGINIRFLRAAIAAVRRERGEEGR